MGDAVDANTRWAEMLSQWAIPDELISAAPTSPYFFDPQVFIQAADDALARTTDTPSDEAARQALPADGSVLDVACGAGAASLRLQPARAVGVDPSSTLLAAFAERAARLGVDAATVEGVWPDVASQCPNADVVVCHHIVYNVADLASFATALDEHASQRVVVELTAAHPMAWMTPYWERLHGLAQPDRPTADDAVAVLAERGFDVQQARSKRAYQMIGETGDESLERIGRRLCLPPARHDELRQLLVAVPPPREREMITLWW
jgi:SAM-dependent methyltransferase